MHERTSDASDPVEATTGINKWFTPAAVAVDWYDQQTLGLDKRNCLLEVNCSKTCEQ